MNRNALVDFYRGYIACLNAQDWRNLGRFVHEEVSRNGTGIGLVGYRTMLEGDFAAIPDLVFKIDLLAADPPLVASRLRFDCSPAGHFLGLPVNGRRVSFAENVFYRLQENRIIDVRSLIDREAIAAQL